MVTPIGGTAASLPARPPPESSRPSAHASLIADLFDRALGEEATPGHDLQVGRVGQYLANTWRTDGPVDGADGGAVFVFGQANCAFATEDEVSRRLAAVQRVATGIASAATVAAGFGIGLATLWRWKAAHDA